MILIGRNGRELCLWEDERAKVFRLRSVFCPLVDVDNVETRLVAVHGIQYDLHNKKRWLGKNVRKTNNNNNSFEEYDALAS